MPDTYTQLQQVGHSAWLNAPSKTVRSRIKQFDLRFTMPEAAADYSYAECADQYTPLDDDGHHTYEWHRLSLRDKLSMCCSDIVAWKTRYVFDDYGDDCGDDYGDYYDERRRDYYGSYGYDYEDRYDWDDGYYAADYDSYDDHDYDDAWSGYHTRTTEAAYAQHADDLLYYDGPQDEPDHTDDEIAEWEWEWEWATTNPMPEVTPTITNHHHRKANHTTVV